ncbi:MAG: PAS domain S-box protein [Desulforhopalus sp.]|nr:PAS domain S-box protein [Desulforhopalus sp.]
MKKFTLPLLLLSSLLVFSAFWMLNIKAEFDRVETEYAVQIQSTAAHLVEIADAVFEQYKNIFLTLARTKVVKEQDNVNTTELFQELRKAFPEIANFAAVDASGSFFASAMPIDRNKPPSAKDLYFFKNLAAGQDFSVMEPHLGPVSAQHVTGIVVALTDSQRQFNGLVGATFPVEVFTARWEELLAKQPVASAMVTDGNGKPFFARGPFFPEGMGTVEQAGYNDLKNLQRDLQEGNGLKYAHYSRQSSLSGWTMHIVSPPGIQFATYLAGHLEIIALGTLLLLMLAWTALLIAKNAKDARLLGKSEELLRSVLDNSRDGINMLDLRTGRYLFINEAQVVLTGFTADEINGITAEETYDRVHPDDRYIFVDQQRQVIEGVNSEKPVEYRWKVKSGEYRWFSDRRSLVRDKDGKPVALVGISRDITERKQAEERIRKSEARLRESEHHFRTLANSDLALIWTAGPDKLCNYFNEPWLRYTGRTLEQELGNGWAEGVHPEDFDRCLNIYTSHFDRREAFSMEYRLRKANGEYGWILDLGNPRHDSEGNFTGYIGYCYDISDRIRAEEEKKILNAQLQQAQKLEAIGTLAGGIAHDFNNILGAIVGYSEIIHDDLPAGSPSIHDIDQVIKASQRAKDLVKQILAFSRQVEDRKIPMQPAAIVKEAITLLRSSLPATITIKQDIDPEAGMVLADPTQIHQIVMNLSTNAFHAMEVKGGILTISLRKKILTGNDLATESELQPGTFVQLSIRDSGEGISPGIQEKIFDPFFTTKEVGKGTGLGLSMVYSIVKSCHGSIACDSRLGEGTEFRITLPALEEDLAVQDNGSTDFIPSGKEHILFIDDEEMLVELGKAMLERLGYHVTARRTSLDALTTFQNQPDTFDLVITDQTMPGMTGFDLARRILQIRPHMPIILCTGYSSLITEDVAKAAGIKGFALKPLAKKDIGELIRKVLDVKNS